MLRYIGRRLLQTIPVFFGATFLIFAMVYLMPGDPVAALGGVSLAYVIRLTRQSVSENVSADYVRTARAKGLTNRAVMSRHILRNSLIPVATFIGGDLGALMGGAIITEGIFNIHGVGGTLWNAIIKGEPQTVVSVTTVLVLVYIIANLIVDLLYAVLDPRIRYE